MARLFLLLPVLLALPASCLAQSYAVDIPQVRDGSALQVSQSGVGNTALAQQRGQSIATLAQEGDANRAEVSQDGLQHLGLTQTGSGNFAAVEQSAGQNVAVL